MAIELTVTQIGGFYNQLYNLENDIFTASNEEGALNMNTLFWASIFRKENIESMVDNLCKMKSVNSTKLQAVRHNPLCFLKKVDEALLRIRNQNLNAEECFCYLETLQIVCYIHTFLYSLPFELTLYEGYKHDQFSAKNLIKNSLLPHCNPYYSFIKEVIIPNINLEYIDILWLKGRPNLSGICLVKLLKEKFPNMVTVLIDNNTEFFSYNKIATLLIKNNALFSVFDCIVLNDNPNTYNQLRNCIIDNGDIGTINNIIFSPDNGCTIIPTKKCFVEGEPVHITDTEIKMNKTINLKLYPSNQCFWNKCSFCAINKKYLFQKNNWDICYPLSQLKRLNDLGLSEFWALDEAIPVEQLYGLSKSIIENQFNFSWHVRTRIDKKILMNNLPIQLKNAGLKHILFGFESASPRILKLMNKTDDIGDYVHTAEEIVKVFSRLEVYVHFPIIIGYPTESQRERDETYKFLAYLANKYPYFSFNINILSLDVSSKLYSSWDSFDISSLKYPCEPSDFIGNSIMWDTYYNHIDISTLYKQAEKIMKLQYAWYPDGSLLDVISFYAMWEYSRSQLNCSSVCTHFHQEIDFDDSQICVINDNTVAFEDEEGLFCIYNFNNHQSIRGGKMISDIIKKISQRPNINQLLQHYKQTPVYGFIRDLIKYGFINISN